MPVITKHYDLDTDGTLSNNSDIIIPSQKAVKTYADTKQSAINDLSYIRTQVSKIDDKIASQDITDSGSSLPATTAYSVGDTFLNTNDKKLHTTLAPSWQLNNNTTVPSSISIDLNTGIASGFYRNSGPGGTTYNYIKHTSYNYSSNNPIYVHFKSSSDVNAGGYIVSLEYTYSYVRPAHITLSISSSRLYFSNFNYYQGSTSTIFSHQLFDADIEASTEYYVYIFYENGEYIATLSKTGYNRDIIETTTIEESTTFSTQAIIYGGVDSRFATYDEMQVYLLDSIGEFLIPDGDLTWDSGTALEDNTQYNDKTNIKTLYYNNGILYDITIPAVNDAVLTIQQNGTTMATFSANASTNTTLDMSTSVVKFRDWSDD